MARVAADASPAPAGALQRRRRRRRRSRRLARLAALRHQLRTTRTTHQHPLAPLQILHEETLFQAGTDGEPLVAKLAARSIVPGIKVGAAAGLLPLLPLHARVAAVQRDGWPRSAGHRQSSAALQVDIGLVPLPASPDEQLTQGLDGLRERCGR
jgi:fructose-bisphosphate aldolase class 1